MRVLNKPATLGIYLRPTPDRRTRVGALHRDPEGAMTFVVDQSYIALGPTRPVCSLSWKSADLAEDGPKGTKARLLYRGDKIGNAGQLPIFFENLLPEGALLELIQKEFGVGAFDSFDVLRRLGHDLPGAVLAVQESGTPPPAPVRNRQDATVGKIRFSLAGVQLKFSMKQNIRGAITLPMEDASGDVILKTPSEKFPMLPEGEFAAMTLARAVGVETADVRLVSSRDIQDIDAKYLKGGEHCLVVTRFDRGPDGLRIHTEDFAQVVGAVHDLKYDANQTMLARLVSRFVPGRGQVLQAVRRIVNDVMVGNSDSHLKNWSFSFPNEVDAVLSPEYDITPMFYLGDDEMALEFAGSKDPRLVGFKSFERLAKYAGVEFSAVKREVRQTVEKIFDVWPGMLPNLPMPSDFAERLTKRWEGLALTREVRPTMIPGFTVEKDEPAAVGMKP
jgi:serine/threonine-protein kinase HipA